jgi:hypothetical protein
MQLSPIWSLVKEFLLTITQFNLEIIKSIVQGVSIFITKKMVVQMFQLLETSLSKLPTKPTKEKEKEKEAVIY